MNNQDALKFIHGRKGHLFVSLLKLWIALEEEKQMAMEDRDPQNRDTTPLIEMSTFFEQSILFLAQA